MSPTLNEQIEQLKKTITDMEAQRASLGDTVVDAALAPLQHKLDELTDLLVAKELPSAEEPAQQRKLVTLLFMDIAGSTNIAQHMDPEDVAEVFDVTLKKLAMPIEAHGGRVTRFMGDGFLSVFGAPTAQEDDPERAVKAGLEIIELSQDLARELLAERNIPDFQVRVGINTGLVLLGGQTEAEDTLMGAAVNLAARLESAAPAGGLLISHDTYRHVRGVFDVEPWEPLKVKGFDEPAQVYRVLRARGEWNLAMKEIHKSLAILHQGGSLLFIRNRNLELAIIILELNRFGVSDNLLEAEKALREYLAIGGNRFEAFCLLCIVFARQGQFQDAYERLSQAGDIPRIQTHGLESITKTRAEFELALVEKRWEEAVSICASYIDTFKNHGYRWEWARRLIDLGDALNGRDSPGDREQAKDVFKQSMEMFTEMGAPGYIKVLEERMKE